MNRKSKWKLTTAPEDNSAVVEFCQGLFQIVFKTLRRPARHHNECYSDKELRWALRVFTASSMCFFRDLLRTYLILRSNRLDAGSFVVLRAMYETLSGGHYMHGRYMLHHSTGAGDPDEVWNLLSKFIIGSKILKYHQPAGGGTDIPEPVKLGDTINSLDSILPHAEKGSAYVLYRHLSEFSHPDALTFSHYCQMDATSNSAAFYSEPEPDTGILRQMVGRFISIAGIVYGNLFVAAELHTAERRLAKLVIRFKEAELKYPKPARK